MNTNNKVIAEFMGRVIPEDKLEFWDENPTTHYYDTDWNWLIEVVEKIENLEDLERFEITTFNVSIQYYETKQKRFDYNLYFSTIDVDSKVIPKIEGVYNACLKFIKWYNEQK